MLWSQQVMKSGELRAVATNSGGANACTGPEGFADTHHTAEWVAELLDCGPGEVAVCSTGLIGERLPMNLLIPVLRLQWPTSLRKGRGGHRGSIMTTDTVPKTAVVAGMVSLSVAWRRGWDVGPGLATMLCTITTDAVVDSEVLQRVLRPQQR